jgi:hypothetical protein
MTSTARFDNWQNRLGTQAGSIDASGNVTFDNDVTVSGGATVSGDLTVTGNMTSANQGLVFIKSQTIGSAVSSVTVTDAFSSTFDNYRIVINSHTSDNSAMLFQLQSGSANLYGNRLEMINTLTTVTVIASGVGGQATAEIGRGGTSRQSFISLDAYNPSKGYRKGIIGNYYGNGYNGTFGYESPDTAVRTGFILSRTSGTFTAGTIKVYGYNNG